MTRKFTLLSAYIFCIYLLSGTAFAANSSSITSEPLAAPHNTAPTLLAKTENTGEASVKSTVKSAAKAVEKKAKEIKDKVTAPAKAAKEPKTAKEAKAAKTVKEAKTAKESKATKEAKAAKEPKSAKAKDKAVEKAAKDKAAEKTMRSKTDKKAASTASARKYQKKKTDPVRETTMMRQNRHDARTFTPAYSSENCVCIDGFYCVGPRGGHYCYTSGGNKRYLKRD